MNVGMIAERGSCTCCAVAKFWDFLANGKSHYMFGERTTSVVIMPIWFPEQRSNDFVRVRKRLIANIRISSFLQSSKYTMCIVHTSSDLIRIGSR